MKKSAILVSLLVVIMCSATVAFARTTEYFHADKQARIYNEISSFQAMRNDLILKKMNVRSNDFGYAAVFLDNNLSTGAADKFFSRFIKRNAGKKHYFIIMVGPDMKPACISSDEKARSTAFDIMFKSMYGSEGKIFAGLLMENLVETMKHR